MSNVGHAVSAPGLVACGSSAWVSKHTAIDCNGDLIVSHYLAAVTEHIGSSLTLREERYVKSASSVLR